MAETPPAASPPPGAHAPSQAPAAAATGRFNGLTASNDGALSAQREFEARSEDHFSELKSQIKDLPALSSHSGVRYGMPLGSDAVLLPKSRLVNVFAQIRDKFGGGLAVFGDYVPSVSDKFSGETFYLQWQRLTFGYSLGINFETFLQRLEVTPRVGGWQVSGRFPRQGANGGLTATQFNFKRQSLGFEMAASAAFIGSSSMRLWHARDAATNLNGKTQVAGGSSQRIGLDIFLPTPSFTLMGRKLTCAVLGYVMRDTMFLTERATKLSELISVGKGRDQSAADETFYSLYYAGTGLSLIF